MYVWKVVIDVWPFSTGESRDAMQKKCGGAQQMIEVHADDIGGALNKAELYAQGIRTNPAVWQTKIFEIKRIRG